MPIHGMLAQADPRALEALERIATAQLVMAGIMTLIALVSVAVVVVILLQLRSLRRMVDEMHPRLAPLIDRATHITSDVAGATDNVRRKVDDVLHTVEELRRSLERARAGAEERVASFGAVLDVVQTETEELLLDAAATARGVHETARALREPPGTSRGRRAAGVSQQVEAADEEDVT
jgi:methyl-accepting chemotaxis protein